MTEGYVEFSKIASARIREDGEEIDLVCLGSDGGEFEMVVPTRAIPGLINELSIAYRGALIKQKNPQPVPVRVPRFVDAPAVFVATGISGVAHEDGQIDLQIEALNQQAFVVALASGPAKTLFHLLLQVYNLDDQRPS